MDATQKVAKYIKDKGIKISVLSEKTGISRSSLDLSFSSYPSRTKQRMLKADELLDICDFLGLNPMDFKKDDKEEVE